MKKFSQEQIKRLNEEAKAVLDSVSEGESAREIMARIYVDRLEDKTPEQGFAMADAIVECVHNFDKDYMEAREDLDKYLRKFVKKAEKGKNVQERCDYWLRLAASVNAAAVAINDETADRNQLSEDIKNLSVPEEDATEEKAEELRNEALEAIRNSGILMLGIQQSAEELKEIESADETATLLTDIGIREIEARAVMSMIAYTEVKSGEYEDIPVDMTVEDVTTSVCITAEEISIAEGVENGTIHVEVAEILLNVLGIIAVVGTALLIAYIGFSVVTTFLIPFWIKKTLLIGMIYGLICLCGKLIEGLTENVPDAARVVVKGVKVICRGFKTLFSFLYEKVILGAVKLAKKMWNNIRSKGKKNAESEEFCGAEDDDVIEIIDDEDGIVAVATV